jgi:ABC-type Zn uptake system ZnuABC Zn-binding protein ZnuA
MRFYFGGNRIRNKWQKKYILLFIGISLFFTCFTYTIQAEESDINIICSNSILADFTSNLITEKATIEYIMPSGVCPAFYDTTPSDVSKIISADIVITFGSPQKEPWIGNLLSYNPDADLIECKNLGEWNIPTGAITYIQLLTNELSNLLPFLNETINENAQIYTDQINDESQQLLDMIEVNDYINKKIVCMKWQEDFLIWLGLNVTYSYGPPQGLSVQDELEVIAASENAYAIVDNLQSGTDFGARIASELGATHVIFTNFPGAIPNTDTYLDMITYNTEQLIKGIATYEQKQGEISDLQSQISDLELQRNISLVLALIFVILTFTIFIMYRKK